MGVAPIQPQEMIALGRSKPTQRYTQGWLEFHRSKRQWSDLDPSVPKEPAPPPDSLRLVTIVPEYAQLLANSAEVQRYARPKVPEELAFARRIFSVVHLQVNINRSFGSPAGQLTDVREAVRVLRQPPLSRAITPEAWAAPGFVKHEMELDCTVGLDRRTGLVDELISLIELD